MEHKYNQLNLERYSATLAKVLCDRYFAGSPSVNGQQIIGFTPVKQVNLFIIKELLHRWNQEMANLQSPYFDFENDEVKEALVQFMNVLSRKINIKRPHFEPLLVKAIADTFKWVIDPVPAFEDKFMPLQDNLTATKLQSNLKYISLNKELVKDFLDTLGSGSLNYHAVLHEFRSYLAGHKQNLMPVEALVDEFNALAPLQKTDLMLNQNGSPASGQPVPPTSVPPTPVFQNQSEANHEPLTKASAPDNRLNEKFRGDKQTLNERLAKPANTLADNQMGKKIESLKDSISINQRFGFINELFNGENMQYYNAIKTLDEFKDAESAKDFVQRDLAPRYDWSKKEDHVNKLLRLIERKFS